MDLNQSIEFNTSSIPSPQVHNFMPMSSFLLPYHQATNEEYEEARYSHFMQVLKQNLKLFWNQQMMEIHNISVFKNNHHLPLTRIKRVMKSDGVVKMISADTPVLFSKACELFILELTLRSWLETEECKRRTLQRCDIARAIRHDGTFNFLVRAVPFDHHHKDDETGKFCELEPFPAFQYPFPMTMDLNGNLLMNNPQVPNQQLVMNPSVPSAEFNYDYASK